MPALDEATLRERWPFPPGALTVVDGAMDALDRITSIVVRLGDRVLVEHPASRRCSTCSSRSAPRSSAVAVDDQGIVPDALQAALAHRPVALYLQPRAQNPLGVSMTPPGPRRWPPCCARPTSW